MEKTYAYEDFRPGRVFPLGPVTMHAGEIIEFAREFDPQPMHLSEEAGKASILGGLAASGWHTTATLMRMMIDSYLADSTSEGSPGVDFVEWKRPVLAGDTISGQSEVLDARTLRSRPGIGMVKFRNELKNQHGVVVLTNEHSVMFRIRDRENTAA